MDDEPALEGGARDRTEGVTRRAVNVDAFVHGAGRGRPPEGEDVGMSRSAKMARPQSQMIPRSRKARLIVPRA